MKLLDHCSPLDPRGVLFTYDELIEYYEPV